MKLLAVAVTAPAKRSWRQWSIEAKQRIVEATLLPGASVRRIAQEHGVHPSRVYEWRKTYRRKRQVRKAVNLLPIKLTEADLKTVTSLQVRAIEIELPKGRLRIMGADAVLLRAAMELLQ
jgi:transposase